LRASLIPPDRYQRRTQRTQPKELVVGHRVARRKDQVDAETTDGKRLGRYGAIATIVAVPDHDRRALPLEQQATDLVGNHASRALLQQCFRQPAGKGRSLERSHLGHGDDRY
jgi:hypothetical protein